MSQYEEQLRDLKSELASILDNIVTMDLPDSDDISALHDVLEKEAFGCGLKVKQLIAATLVPSGGLATSTPSSHGVPTDKGMKLPKLEVPTFDGQMINWHSFWEQFEISVHNRRSLSDSEKLVYLKQALKGGTAKNVIEGLSHTGDQYIEAVESLMDRYNRPRLLHQTHVRMILQAANVKEGTGRELRRLHDTVQQHLRALSAMGYQPSGPFITSVIELKLDAATMFEWQKHSQSSKDVPEYKEILAFIDLRARASETSTGEVNHHAQQRHRRHQPDKVLSSFVSATDTGGENCVLCKSEKHPLYMCTKFKSLSYDEKLALLKSHNRCLNCLRSGHFAKHCKSLHHCRKCQKPHHTMLHVDTPSETKPTPTQSTTVTNHAATTVSKSISHTLLMTCRVRICDPQGSYRICRALLDSASSTTFVSERLTQSLCLPRTRLPAKIVGIAGVSHDSTSQVFTELSISPVNDPSTEIQTRAVIIPRVTCKLPVQQVPTSPDWLHLADLTLADPDFGQPDQIDLLLGVDVFVQVMRQGRRHGPVGAPTAFETDFGWVLAGGASGPLDCSLMTIVTHHTTLATGDKILQRFWEIEEEPGDSSNLSVEERIVTEHFKNHHSRTCDGRFVVPLPKKDSHTAIGESRSQAVRRFQSLERSLHYKGQFHELSVVMEEYFEQKHAELVPTSDLAKTVSEVFYLPIQVVRKESSSTTKLRAVFDASAPSSTGMSLNDTLLVGPTVHSSLSDVLLRFRLHRIALVADVSRMYRAVLLDDADKDLHRFVWRASQSEPLRDYRMNRITFGVAASSYAANMAVKQNAIDLVEQYPMAATVVHQSLYVDDVLTGADTVKEAVSLQRQLHDLFSSGGFTLRKWNSNSPDVLQHIPEELKDKQVQCKLPEAMEYTKTLGIEWNTVLDHFRLTLVAIPPQSTVTKRVLISDVSRVFDVFGWFAPCTVKMKILFQQLWAVKMNWDDAVPEDTCESWRRWRSELGILSKKLIPRCVYDKQAQALSVQLHGFSDASEKAYAAVVYFRVEYANECVQVSLLSSKTKVAPMKKITIPRLELCGAKLLAQLIHRTSGVLGVPFSSVYAWTDSEIVLSWLTGNPRRLKTYVGNRVNEILELTKPQCWRHVSGADNPADCASRGLYPTELINHDLWWEGPPWLKLPSSQWPNQSHLQQVMVPEEEKEISLHTLLDEELLPLIPLERYSSYLLIKHITAWVLRFIANCRAKSTKSCSSLTSYLTIQELYEAEVYWFSYIQRQHFPAEISAVKSGKKLNKSSPLLSLHPFLDDCGILRVGGREQHSTRNYSSRYPVILHGKHAITRLLIRYEHLRLMHAGPTLLSASLNRRVHIIGGRRTVRSITRACTVCRRAAARPQTQKFGQLPPERVTPDLVFSNVGLDYAGPLLLKLGAVRKPKIVKAYVCVFVSMSVKAVHLELVSDLTTEAFIACLRRFVSRRGKPVIIWSDHGKNFVGANRELKELTDFLGLMRTQKTISEFCSTQSIQWKFIPPHAPHFGGLWEAAVKSLKMHLRRVAGNVKLTFEEMVTVLTQIEACLNSRPITQLSPDSDCEALTPGHFLVGRPLEALPDSPQSLLQPMSMLRRWHLCQAIVRHFWRRWSSEYLVSLRKFTKWHSPTKNIEVDDVVVLREDNMIPSTWPIARVIEVHPGEDGLVRAVTVKTNNGQYRRPIVKIAPLLLKTDC